VTSLAVRPDLTELSRLTEGLEAFGATQGVNPAIISVVQLALADLVTGLSGGASDIYVRLAIEEAVLIVRVETRRPDPIPVPLDLVASLMDEVSDSYLDGRQVITLRKAIGASGSGLEN
jgi:hypothetical protein